MTHPIIDTLTQEVQDTNGVMESATMLINGFAEKLQAGIDEALANGASEAALAHLVGLEAELQSKKEALAAAVAANP